MFQCSYFLDFFLEYWTSRWKWAHSKRDCCLAVPSDACNKGITSFNEPEANVDYLNKAADQSLLMVVTACPHNSCTESVAALLDLIALFVRQMTTPFSTVAVYVKRLTDMVKLQSSSLHSVGINETLRAVRVTHYVITVLDSSLALITRLPRMICGSLGFVRWSRSPFLRSVTVNMHIVINSRRFS